MHVEGETGTETLGTDEHAIPVTRSLVTALVPHDVNQGTDKSGCAHAQSST